MNFFLVWKDGAVELQAYNLGESVALSLIAVVAPVALALIFKRSR